MEKSFLKSMLTEPGTEDWSHKRIIGSICAISLIICMFWCTYTKTQQPPTSIVEAVAAIALGCILGTVGERIITAYKGQGQSLTQTTTQNEAS